MVIEVSAEHPLKASLPIEVTLSGMVIEVSAEHPSKKLLLILVRPLPIVADTRDEQPLKALLAMEVTVSGMVTEVSEEQFVKTPPVSKIPPILVTFLPMDTDSREVQFSKA